MKALYISIIFLITFSITNSQDTTIVFTREGSSEKLTESTDLLDDTFTELTTVNLTGVSHGSAVWGDYDNDGDLDILLSGLAQEPNEISKIYRNDGNDIFTEMTSISLTGVRQCEAAWGDYDNDGDLDILLIGMTGGSSGTRVTKIYRNESNSFVEQTLISLVKVDWGSVAWGDYDNDGDLDILITGRLNSIPAKFSMIYRNEGNNEFIAQSSISLVGVWKSSVAWGDYDNDGDLDILFTGLEDIGPTSRVYRNEGGNSFSEQTSISLTDVGGSSANWGDYDSDGDLDILLTGWSASGNISKIYRNEGNNSFSEQSSISLTGVSSNTSRSSAWSDYDNDGDLDILLTGDPEVSKIYRNNGDNTFTEMTSINLIDVYDSCVDWGDYDNDGDLDLIITGSTASVSRNTKIYKNNSIIANTTPTSPTNLSSVGDSTSVTLSWNKSTDNETPQVGLKYNIVLGKTPGAVDVVSPMSDRSTGFRRVVEMGNTNCNNSWTINGLAPGIYYWSVQAIDNNFAGSNFSTEKYFVLPTTLVTWSNQISIADFGGVESSKILTFGQHPNATDSIDTSLGEYELPPPPPTGIFDARFNLPTNPIVSSFIDYRDSSKKEITWIMQFQSGSEGYPITFSWDSTSFPEGTFYLKDRINGSFVNVNMKNQSSYVLTNPVITSLKISYRGVCSSISVNNGWNMISVPLLAEDMALNNLFSTATSSAYGYENGYATEDTLVASKGYWLKFGGNELVQICGSIMGDTVVVKEGWNLIGPFEENIPVTQLTTTPPGIIATYFFGYEDGYQIADTLKSGKGYWIRVTSDGVINLNSGGLFKVGEEGQLAQVDQNWGKIIITDNEGKSITLYATEVEIESGYLSGLPPVPPSGIFDARFSSGKFVEDLSSVKEILINSESYPITISAEGISIAVKDRITGEILIEELSDGEEIRITNNKITSIEVSGRIIGGLPISYELYQNYPNPFNPSTTIKFAVPKESNVNLSIYNVVGELVSTLVNKEMKLGYYEIEFNASNLASGMYIYIIKAGDFIETKKMILLK